MDVFRVSPNSNILPEYSTYVVSLFTYISKIIFRNDLKNSFIPMNIHYFEATSTKGFHSYL